MGMDGNSFVGSRIKDQRTTRSTIGVQIMEHDISLGPEYETIGTHTFKAMPLHLSRLVRV